MSSVNWTNEQLEAITESDCNLLVAAAAGSGKTAVLVERIIRKITDKNHPIDIDKILVMTFTKAAASEMREKITQAVSKVLEENPESRSIHRQMALLGKASINTIHSFCTEVIRANFDKIDIDPNFRVAEQTESTLILQEALEEVFENQYEEKNKEFLDLLESYSTNKSDEELMNTVLELFTFVQSSPWPQEWLDKHTEELKVEGVKDFGEIPWGKILIKTIKIELQGWVSMLERAIRIIDSEPTLEPYMPMYEQDLRNIKNILNILDIPFSAGLWDDLYLKISNPSFSKLGTVKKDYDEEKKKEVAKIRDDIKDGYKKLNQSVISEKSEVLLEDLKALYPRIKCLSNLVIELSKLYKEKKKSKSVLDFNDLEHYCLEILTRTGEDGKVKSSPTALEYRSKFQEIMVDEYQDSNEVQELIIKMVSREDDNEPNIFMVGDVKQSIYRFRQARPEIFMDKYNKYSERKGESFRKILLFKNFRSRENIINAVNFIFRQIMSSYVGELDYTQKEELNLGAAYPEVILEKAFVGGATELLLINTQSPEEDNEEEINEDSPEPELDDEVLDKIQMEGRFVAQRIKALLRPDEDGNRFSVYDKKLKAYREADYRDIVILLRTTRNWSDVFTEELSMEGIPVFSDVGENFLKTVEIEVMLSLLQIIDNPMQDIPLLSVLRSPIFNFTTDDMIDIKLNKKGHLFSGVIHLATQEENLKPVNAKAAKFYKCLSSWRKNAQYMPTDQLIRTLYDETDYYMIVGAMPSGEQRQANLRILFERAKLFEETSYKGLFNFINYIDKIKTSSADMGSAKILSENDNVVRIMSIHKSKGLEFPIVFLSGCGKQFNMQDTRQSIILHQDLGFGPDMVDLDRRLKWSSPAKQAIRSKLFVETLSEEMRILYVALTRAREKLIITGAINDADRFLKKWVLAANSTGDKIQEYNVIKGKTYLDWICPTVIRHQHCDELRKLSSTVSDFEGDLIDDNSTWHVKFVNGEDLLKTKEKAESDESEFDKWLNSLGVNNKDDNNLKAEIDRRLSWDYKYRAATEIGAKITVTELKRRFQNESKDGEITSSYFKKGIYKKPLFLEEKRGFSAAKMGTIMHFVMQMLDLSSLKGEIGKEKDYSNNIRAQIDKMVKRDLLSRVQADNIEIDLINGFFISPIGKRVLAADLVNREIPFNIQIPVEEITGEQDTQYLKGETVLLQGVIDCYFQEGNELVLVDYKTDKVKPGEENEVVRRYKIQMEYYEHALEKITGKKVKQRIIYLFRSGLRGNGFEV